MDREDRLALLGQWWPLTIVEASGLDMFSHRLERIWFVNILLSCGHQYYLRKEI